MPTEREYLRATLFVDEGSISNFTVYGMIPLRLKTSVFDEILRKAQETATQMILEGQDPDFISQRINTSINAEVDVMVKNGEGFAGEPYEALEVTPYLQEFHTWSYIYSHDGYSIFNPAQFHPGTSITKH